MSDHKETPVEQNQGQETTGNQDTIDEKKENTSGLSREELKKIKEEKKKQEKLEKELKNKLKEEKKQQTGQNLALKWLKIDTTEPYGDLEMIQSFSHNALTFTELWQITEANIGQVVRVRARVHSSRVKGPLCFVVLRKSMYSCQAIAFKSDEVSKEMLKYLEQVPKESVIDIVGTVQKPQDEIQTCTQKSFELVVKQFYVISRAEELPFQMEDASRKLNENENEDNDVKGDEESGKLPVVSLTKRLDNRTLDLRVPSHIAIFRIQSMVGTLFREYLALNGFVEIHSPKILGGTSEGGAEIFAVDYFGEKASLSQSPQLYKQMAILAEFGKVYEVGPVFRAENSNTPRHLCEFTGLDFEMEIKESYLEVVDVIGNLFNHIFKGLNERCQKELEVVNAQYPFVPFQWADKFVALTFEESCKLLKEHRNLDQALDEDFNRKNEAELGEIVKELYKTDFYIVHKYPESARPFYTMPHAEKGWTCSYDVFMRGTEIISGAQRCHEVNLLIERTKLKKIDPSSIKYYIDSFRYGSIPHGGVGVGLERVTKLFLDVLNIRKASLFPRDPSRYTP